MMRSTWIGLWASLLLIPTLNATEVIGNLPTDGSAGLSAVAVPANGLLGASFRVLAGHAYTLGPVTLRLDLEDGAAPVLQLYSESGARLTELSAETPARHGRGDYRFTPATPVELREDQAYWLILKGAGVRWSVRTESEPRGTGAFHLACGSGTSVPPAQDVSAHFLFQLNALQPSLELLDAERVLPSRGLLDLGRVAVGERLVRTLTVRNTGDAPLTRASGCACKGSGLGAAIDGVPGFAVTRPAGPIPPGEDSRFVLSFMPRAEGRQRAVLRLESNDPLNSPFEIDIVATVESGVSGTGVQSLSAAAQPQANIAQPLPVLARGETDVPAARPAPISPDVAGTTRPIAPPTGNEAPKISFKGGDRVAARNIAGTPAVLTLAARTIAEGTFSNSNGAAEPGELAHVVVTLRNDSAFDATHVTAVLSSTTPGVTVQQPSADFGALVQSASASNSAAPFVVVLNTSLACGTVVDFSLVTMTDDADPSPQTFTFSFTLFGPPVTITTVLDTTAPPANPGYTESTGTQTGRLLRNGVPSTCAGKANPGLNDATVVRRYDAYTFTNPSSTAVCIPVSLTQPATTLFVLAYDSNGFIPATPSVNYAGDAGSSASASQFSFTVPGNAQFTVVVHEVNPSGGIGATYTLSVGNPVCAASPCQTLSLDAAIPDGAVGTAYTKSFAATGGSGIYTYGLTGTLPAGLAFSGGTLSGTPTEAGSFPITVTATDAVGCPMGSGAYTLRINGAPTDIVLTPSAILENSPAGTQVGVLTTVDPDGFFPMQGAQYTYQLVTGVGDTDNAAVQLTGDKIALIGVPDFETKPSYSIRVKTTEPVDAKSGVSARDVSEPFSFEKAITITVTEVNEPFTLESLSALPNPATVGANVVFTVVATDPENVLQFSYDYGDGQTGTSSTHVYNVPGSFTVVVTVSDGSETVKTRSTVVTVVSASTPSPDLNGDGLVNQMDTDTDNDGFPDNLETGFGTSPSTPGSTPTNAAAKAFNRFRIVRVKVKPGAPDQIAITGILSVPQRFTLGGSKLVFDVGGNVRAFTLDETGLGEAENGVVRLRASSGARLTKEARFALKMSGDLLASLTANAPKDSAGRPTQVTVNVLFNGDLLSNFKALKKLK